MALGGGWGAPSETQRKSFTSVVALSPPLSIISLPLCLRLRWVKAEELFPFQRFQTHSKLSNCFPTDGFSIGIVPMLLSEVFVQRTVKKNAPLPTERSWNGDAAKIFLFFANGEKGKVKKWRDCTQVRRNMLTVEEDDLTHRMSSSLSRSTLTWGAA